MSETEVLIVDDVEEVRQVLSQALQGRGYRVHCAVSAEEALPIIRDTDLDVLLIDIRLPGMNGIELLRRAKEFAPHAEAVFITGYASIETALEALRGGAYDYISKPLDLDHLLRVVEQAARKSQASKERPKLPAELEPLISALDATSLTLEKRSIRFLSLLALHQKMSLHHKIADILSAAAEDLKDLFVYHAFGTLWETDDELAVSIHPLAPLNQRFIEETVDNLLAAYSDELSQSLQQKYKGRVCDSSSRDARNPLPQGRGPKVDLVESEIATTAKPVEEGVKSHITLPMIVGGEVMGSTTLSSAQADSYSADDAQVFSLLTYHLATALKNAQLFQKNEELAITDGLTQLYNHRYFHDHLEQEITRARRYHHPLSLIISDVDSLKRVNDTYGHQIGDRVLKELAAVIQSSVRQVDVAARYGGDEFAIIAPDTSLEEALALAERLRSSVERHVFAAGEAKLQLTLSLGVASLLENEIESKKDLIGQADQALYRAKSQGNRVCS